MVQDPRHALYRHFQASQHDQQIPETRVSARKLFRILLQYTRPGSILDVGCGFGAFLAEAQDLGIPDLWGIEGPWIDLEQMLTDAERTTILDLEQGFSLGRRFDLVICTEVAEHVSEASAGSLIRSLVEHSDLVLFSAAIPLQGGHYHINEQFPDYWAEHFAVHGFRAIDLFRPRIWKDPEVLWWLRQNALLFAGPRALQANGKLAAALSSETILSIVHPAVYLDRVLSLQSAMQEQSAASRGNERDGG
jgi:SAM-dependent methyltransferase